MKKFTLLAISLAFVLPTVADVVWDYTKTQPILWNGIACKLAGVKAPDGSAALEIMPEYGSETLAWTSVLTFATPRAPFRDAGKVEVSFYAKGSPKDVLAVHLNTLPLDFTPFSETKLFPLNGEWKKITYTASYSIDSAIGKIDAPRIFLHKSTAGSPVYLGGVRVKVLEARTLPKKEMTAPAGWRAIDTTSLYVQPGSALDLSKIVSREAAGSRGRAIVNAAGELVFEKTPDRPERFTTIQFIPIYALPETYPSREDLAAYAAAAARQGFNLLRLHFWDCYLSGEVIGGARLKDSKLAEHQLPQTAAEVKFDERGLDTLFRLIAELKENGIYLNMDCMTSFSGFDNGKRGSGNENDSLGAKVQLFVSEEARANWRAGVEKMFTTINPYTGLALKDDPAVIMVSFNNEQDILIGIRDYGEAFHPKYTAYLRKKYGDYAALRQAWGENNLPAEGSFETVPKFGSKRDRGTTPMELDMTAFAAEMMTEMTEFYAKTMREIGYNGLYSNWNMRPFLSATPARSELPLITLNYYHAHPRFGENLVVPQGSALEEGGACFKTLASVRFLDRPFISTEYALCYWNKYRHEQGLLFGAGAALQGWSGMTCHSNNVLEYGQRLNYFHSADDPVVRMSELVTNFAFLRGDVKTSPHSIEIPIPEPFIKRNRVDRGLSDEFARLWPLCRVGVSYGPLRNGVKPDLIVIPDKTSAVGGGLWYTETESAKTTNDATKVVAMLREKGILDAKNASNPAKGIWQSDTNEVKLLSNDAELEVNSPRLAGAVLKEDRVVTLGDLTIRRCSIPASITLISLDNDKALAESKRLLLVITTDARNSNMKFADADESTLLDRGTLPVIVRTGTFAIELQRRTPVKSAKVYVLALNGARLAEIPAELKGQRLSLAIDTAKTPVSPSPCYEIILE